MGQLRKNLHDLQENGRVGDWCFVDTPKGMLMFLRHPIPEDPALGDYWPIAAERGEIVSLPLSGDKHPVWQWDGNRDAPTLTPSINVVGRWHGWIRGGILSTA